MEGKKRLADKMESDRREMALSKMKHEERMSQEHELLDQQVKFQKTIEVSQQEQNAKKTVTPKLSKLSIKNSTQHLEIGCLSGINSRPKWTQRN